MRCGDMRRARQKTSKGAGQITLDTLDRATGERPTRGDAREGTSSGEPPGELGAEGRGSPTREGAELSSDFSRRFWEMEVDREAMRNYYVIHEHTSRRLHWDLRLERDGVLKSWAIPKEPPAKAGVKRLAVAVEDHPLAYGTFEGEIPPGNYGAGAVRVWDSGRYEPLELSEVKWVFTIKGRRLSGKYCLIRLRPREGEARESWLFFKLGD